MSRAASTVPLMRVMRLKSGDFITADEIETEGDYPVYGGNGHRGYTDRWNTEGPIALIGRQGAHCGNVHIAQAKCWVSEHAFRCFPEKRYSVEFIRFALETLSLNQYSVSAAQPGLSTDNLKPLPIPFPPLETQKRIAAFLDEKTAQIDGLIARKQALLARLAEKRQAIITQAVTKGLNPAAPMKDSGIDWLGQIPEHWEVRRIKEIGTLIGGAGFPHEYQGLTDLELPFFKVMDLGQVAQNEPLMETSNSIDRPTARALGASIISAGDIVFAKVGAALLLNRFRKIGRDCCIDNNMMAFRPSALIGSEFALQALSRIKFTDIVNPGAVPSINGKQIGELCIALPPKDEQIPITAYILEQSIALEYAESRVSDSLDRLAEYRSALITSAVTGQIEGLQ